MVEYDSLQSSGKLAVKAKARSKALERRAEARRNFSSPPRSSSGPAPANPRQDPVRHALPICHSAAQQEKAAEIQINQMMDGKESNKRSLVSTVRSDIPLESSFDLMQVGRDTPADGQGQVIPMACCDLCGRWIRVSKAFAADVSDQPFSCAEKGRVCKKRPRKA